MASNPPGKCCTTGFRHIGDAKGNHSTVFGLDTYVTGQESNDKIIVIMTDIFGNRFNNVLLIADAFGDAGYKVLIPDILDNDPIHPSKSQDFNDWKARHNADFTRQISEPFVKAVKSELKPKFLGLVGYCFGAKYAIQLIDEKAGVADAAAVAHPSFVSMEEIAAVGKKPLLISAAEEDSIFPPENRHATEAKLQEIGAVYQLDIFSGTSHGFAARGDISNPAVKYAKEKVFYDQVYWFDHFSAPSA
ncbi:LAMI_0F05160g1_1 [Lachancea mirantina]|uniref:LAMI_0F05160g1_1 n=1 Tax=Lachancea mirantina TaxID=1230905 RepID=A0A1G4JY74_9SACH|nr:LAMI_0F05160g1_1 [Lachancea mirantina]